MNKLDLLIDIDNHICNLENLSKLIETLKSSEPWFQSSVIQNWVTLKITTQYLRDSLIRLKREIG